MPDEPTYWFPAKRHGWGWGVPATWQGWVVLAAFLALIAVGVIFLLPSPGPLFFYGYVAVLIVALVGVCWWKGEPPRWRRGK